MASNIPIIVQGNSFSLAIPLQIYYINGDQMDLEDYTPDPTDEVSVQLKGSRRNYTYTPTIDGNVANIDLSGNELADNYSVVVSIVKANGQRLRSFRTDQFFIVESSDDLTTDDIIEGLEENVIYLNTSIFIAGADGRGIENIEKTATAGLVDTYTITYTDDTTTTFQVTNGQELIVNLVDTQDGDFEVSDEDGNVITRFADGEVLTQKFDSAKATQAEDDASTADLNVSDDDGNVLAQFKDGGIKTKHFDSARFTLNGKTYSILGDSISTYQGYLPSDEAGYDGATYAHFYPRTGLNNVEQTWWRKMEQITGLTLLKNCSWSGSTCCGDSTATNTAQAGCSTRRVADLANGAETPDIIIIYIGINDMYGKQLGEWDANEEIPAEGTINYYAEAYALLLSKVMQAYPSAEIYCCSLLECPTVDVQADPKTFPCINSHGESLWQYNQAIENICKGIGANFIDMHSCGITYWNCYPTYFLDTTHPNANGATLMAEYISTQILSLTKLNK